MISVSAFHGNPILRKTVTERLSLFADQGQLLNGGDRILRRSAIIAALADGDYDLATVHHAFQYNRPLWKTLGLQCGSRPQPILAAWK